MTFYDQLQQWDWQEDSARFLQYTSQDVERALERERISLEDFEALISPAAEAYLRPMAIKAEQMTQRRFGRTIQLYAPLYISNYCSNHCVYCGFNSHNRIKRVRLSIPEILQEVEVLKSWGMRHLLLVAGEDPWSNRSDYYLEVVSALRPHFAQLSIEVQPLSTSEYRQMIEAGVSYVCVYQETYHEAAYGQYHLSGSKANYRYRLETPERCAEAGIRKIGIGALLGLEHWRTDALYTARHLQYLERHHWRSKYSISLPRLRPHVGSFTPQDPISDRQMAQLICAYRLLDPEVEISLSTRESAPFRDMAMRLGVTTMSAASSTEPGGYAHPGEELEQFAINDSRSVQEMAEAIRSAGYEVVWKDWDEWL